MNVFAGNRRISSVKREQFKFIDLEFFLFLEDEI